jgi:hypothetical protein
MASNLEREDRGAAHSRIAPRWMLKQRFEETCPIVANEYRLRSIVSFQSKITFQESNETGE